jgi:uroporphyrinogen decarboxylase
MTHRERILAAYHRRIPDRLPWSLGMTPPVLEVFRQHTGASDPVRYYDFDVSWVGPNAAPRPTDWAPYYAGRTYDGSVDFESEWGYAMVQKEPGSHFRHYESPFDAKDFTPDDARRYPLPDYRDPVRYAGVAERNRQIQAQGYATQYIMGFSTFDFSWLIRGFELFLADLATEEESSRILMDRVSDTVADALENVAACGADIVGCGEDVGMQNALIMGPDLWRREIKPRFRKIISRSKRANPDVLFFYHSDGNIAEIIPDLIEIGVDILNPVQPECMDVAAIKAEYGDRLSFNGGIGTQTVMPRGTPAEVRAAVRVAFETMGRGGGYCCAPSHTLEPEVPWDNIVAFVETCRECRY